MVKSTDRHMTYTERCKRLERILAEYIERYGVTESARAYFRNLYMELPNDTRAMLEGTGSKKGPG